MRGSGANCTWATPNHISQYQSAWTKNAELKEDPQTIAAGSERIGTPHVAGCTQPLW